MRDDVQEVFGDIDTEQGWNDSTCLGLLCDFLIDSGLAERARAFLREVACEEKRLGAWFDGYEEE